MCRRISRLARSAQRELLAELEVTLRGEPIDALIAHLKELREDVRERVLDRVRARTRDPAANQRSLLGWDELDHLARAGIDIEAHGATHAILTRIAATDAERELRLARARLLERGHGRHALLAYPSGAHDAQTRRLARATGYAAAVTTEPGYADAAIDPFAIPRLGVHDDVARTRAEFLETIRG
jgi:peptidoglycan/xylan/chitin deacetylase (PgdA/CDA1 family)